MLDNKKLHELISVTKPHINLTETVIEKDYYVTQIIHALSDIENDYFRLVFAGGTCLAKAHKIVKRMSEDVDYKIQVKQIENFSKSRMLKELKEFRSYIQSKLTFSNMTTGDPRVRNEGQYSRIEIIYPSLFPLNTNLRPHVLLEFTVSDVRLSIESLSVRTLIEDILEKVSIFSNQETQCITIEETAIEKWVGLTRRIMAIERGYHSDDKTLIRHIYDLNAIKKMDRITDNFFALARTIVTRDAKQFKNQHPEYSDNPISEIKRSLALLKNKSLWKERYQEFIETMVYDNASALEYESAVNILNHLSEKVMESLCLEIT
jgi:predicted nucleotidyltransferase component of viral defense system